MGGGAGDDRGGEETYAERPQRSAPQARPAASKPASKPATGFDNMDDDIPF
jgi:single-strand DNA-binding protein